MDEEMIKAAINRCDQDAGRLEKLFRQDSTDMEECTRGEILDAYRQAMDKGVEMTAEIRRLLAELYIDYAVTR